MKKVNIENHLCSTKFKTKEEISKETGLDIRTVRNEISKLKNKRVVISSSRRKGYRLAREYRSMSSVERKEELNLIQQSLNEKKSRVKALKQQMRKDIAYIKKAEQIELEEQNYNHIPRID